VFTKHWPHQTHQARYCQPSAEGIAPGAGRRGGCRDEASAASAATTAAAFGSDAAAAAGHRPAIAAAGSYVFLFHDARGVDDDAVGDSVGIPRTAVAQGQGN
jgi:hypothetical protein